MKRGFISFMLWIFIICNYGIVISADGSEGDNTFFAQELQTLQRSNIVAGDPSGDLRLEDELTRAEFSAILCRANGLEDQADTEAIKNKHYFIDVPPEHWAAGYINAAFKQGAINGVGNNIFEPEQSATNEQVIKMLVAAWGYTKEAEDSGSYPNGYMAVAKQYGITDPVLFNYGVATKRWVAFTFTYGALSMPVSGKSDITTPIKTKPIEKQPQAENSNYIKNPVSVLNKITTQSARYERLVFEQVIPTDENIPFLLSNNELSYLGDTENKMVKFSSSNPNEKTDIISGDFTKQDSFNISGIPVGRWQFVFMVKEGAISDSYFVYIAKENETAEARLDSAVTRYTSLHVQPVLDTVQNKITLSNAETDDRCPFDIKVTNDGNGSSILYINYPRIVENDYTLSVSLNSEDLSLSYNQMVEGDGTVTKPFIIGKLERGEKYHLQVVLNYEYGGDTSLYGDIIIFNNNSEDDFSFTGFVRTLDVIEYKIVPYDE